MNRSGRSSNNSVSLFPFLAVLVCTMGALIFLLLVMTTRIRSAAEQQAVRPSKPAPVPTVVLPPPSIPIDEGVHLGLAQAAPFEPIIIQPPPVEEPEVAEAEPIDPDANVRAIIGQLKAERDEKRKYLARQQAALTATRSALEQRKAELGQLAVDVHAINERKARLAQTAEQLEQLRTGLSGQLAKLKEQLQKAKEPKSAAPSRYSIVPYDGLTGTSRRPLYIEFCRDGVRFLPEDILLTKDQLEGFTLGFNPLLAGAQALVHYHMLKARQEGLQEPAPYVLMVVRPSGIEYYPARLLLQNLATPSGYELVEEDLELALPERDPRAAAVCRAAIDRVLAERQRLESQVARNGIGSAFGRGDVLEFQRPEAGGGGGEQGPNHRPAPMFSGGGRPIDRIAPDMHAPEPRLARQSGGAGFGDTPADERWLDPRTGTGAGTGAATGRGGLSSPPGQPFAPREAGGGMGGGETQIATTINPRALQFSEGAGNPSPREFEAYDPTANRSTRGSSPPDAPGVEPPTGDAASQPQGTAMPSPNTGRSSLPSLANGQYTGGASTNRSGQGDGAAGASGANGGSGGPDQQADQRMPAEPVMPETQIPAFRRPSLHHPDAAPRRRRWGHSDPQGTIGFEREVVVRADGESLVIGEHTIPAGPDMDRDEVLRNVLTAVELKARTWGPAPKKFYWSPTLRFQVTPAGNADYERLRGPLGEWGLTSRADALVEQSSTPVRGRNGGASR